MRCGHQLFSQVRITSIHRFGISRIKLRKDAFCHFSKEVCYRAAKYDPWHPSSGKSRELRRTCDNNTVCGDTCGLMIKGSR